MKRVINLVRTSGHGGSLVFPPEVVDELEPAVNWIDFKYALIPDVGGLRFSSLLESMIRRVGELYPENSSVEDAWGIFKNSKDIELDHLEEAFFELARLFSDLMQVDGALVLDKRVWPVANPIDGNVHDDQKWSERKGSEPFPIGAFVIN